MNQKLADPAPLGLLGFGMTTVLLNLHNAGFYGLNGVTLAMGLAYSGLPQVIAGIMEYKNGNTLGAVAFSSFGLFWCSLRFPIINFEGTLAHIFARAHFVLEVELRIFLNVTQKQHNFRYLHILKESVSD